MTAATAERRAKYHSIPFRREPLEAFRSFFPVDGVAGKIYVLLLKEAIANPQIQKLLKETEGEWESNDRGFIQMGDRTDYDHFLTLMGVDDEKSVTWNSLLLKAFLEHEWVRKAVGDRLFFL